jgi:hypothetical protein
MFSEIRRSLEDDRVSHLVWIINGGRVTVDGDGKRTRKLLMQLIFSDERRIRCRFSHVGHKCAAKDDNTR